jgi:hypothetical protein
MTRPSAEVLDLFAVPGPATPLPGGQGRSVVAGDLVLSPDRDPAVQEWLCPLLARLAVTMDSRPHRRPLDLRIAMPVPARDGSWVVDGWAASRYEPDTVTTRDLDVTLAAGRVLHAELASWVPHRPEGLDRFSEDPAPYDLPSQLVHTHLFGNILIDGQGAPVVIDVSPAWRPARWAEALCVLDAVAAGAAPATVLASWNTDTERELLRRAELFRQLSPR